MTDQDHPWLKEPATANDFDTFLKEEGIFEEVTEAAKKKVAHMEKWWNNLTPEARQIIETPSIFKRTP